MGNCLNWTSPASLPPVAVQNAAFINTLLSQLWPYLNSSLQVAVEEQLIPLMRRKLKLAKCGLLKVDKLDLGTKPFHVEGVDVFPQQENATNITFDIDFNYDGNADAGGSFTSLISFGVKNLAIKGQLRALLGPLGGKLPFAAMSLFFVTMPDIDFELTGAASIGDCLTKPAIEHILKKYLAKSIVFPNRHVVMIDAGSDAKVIKEDLEHPLPRGILSVTVIKVNNMDEESNVFVDVSVREQDRQTKQIDHVLNADFNETFEFPLLEYEGMGIRFEARKKGWLWGFDKIGSADLSLSRIIDDDESGQKMTLKLIGTKNGTMDVKFKWIPIEEETSGGADAGKEKLHTILLIRLGLLKGVEIKDGLTYYTEATVGDHTQETLHAVSCNVDGHSQLRFRDQLRFAQRVSSEEKDISIEVFCSRADSDEAEEPYGKVTIPLQDLVDTGTTQDSGDITLSKDYVISDHSGATLQVNLRQMHL